MSAKKSTKLPVLSQSRDLVPVGPRQVQAKHHGKRDENGLRPSTSRALVLRNGKYGTYGTGELVLASRISGREKLDLLAEDLLSQRARTAIMAPLQLEKCIKIADSQFNAYLDDVATLKDAELFYDKILDEIVARTPQGSARGVQDALSNASYVASVVATRIHNAHMIASGWRIVLDMLRGLVKSGLKDGTAHRQLQKDEGLRSRYLVLCDIVNVLADLGQMQFSVLATTTPHYSRYFKIVENVPEGEPEIAFDWGGLKDVCKSFLDSIIIELCFPRAPYPKRILLQILHDAVDESPREAKRFPQKMWDAVGDLSVTLELQELLESPLLGPEREKLKALPRKMPERYELWLDAQFYSKQASECYDNFKDIISPLEATRDQAVLDQLWGVVDTNYSRASDVSIDALWQLDDAYRRTPQWTAHYTPDLATFYDSDDSDAVRSLVKVRHPRKNAVKKPQKKVLTITDGRDDGVDCDSMPELQSVSESPGETDEYTDSDEQGEVDDEDQESEYESEEEDLYRTMLREAMDAALAIPEFFDPKANVPDFEAMAEERKENPFLKLLSSLRGRMFSSDAKLSAATRPEPREGRFGAKLPTVKGAGKVAPAFTVSFAGVPDDDLPPLQPLPTPREKRVPKRLCRKSFIIPDPSRLTPPAAPQPPQDRRAAVEEVEDEEDAPSVASKKKKKKKKPKKKRAETCGVGTVPEAEASTTNLTSARSPAGSTLKSSMGRPLLSDGHVALHGYASTTSLPIEPTTAKSGHAYLQELGMPKEKIKSRPDHASLFSDKKGFLSKLSGGDKAKEKTEPKQSNSNANTSTWFSRLRKKTAGYMQQLLHPGEEKQGGLKWESFLKVMREMGFSCDPSTAGSSVRFDPPNKRDKSITFHKPHPDPTLHPHKLREFGKRLKEYYGWSEEDFLKRTANA